MAHRIRCIALILTLAGTVPSALAQDVAQAPAEPEGWTGTGELGFAMARGNARSESVNARLAFGRESVDWAHDWSVAALRSKGETRGDFDGDGIEEDRYTLSASRYELGASSAYRFNERNHLSGNARYENDDFAPYAYQATVALGYGRRLVVSERTKLRGEIGPGYRRAREVETGVVESEVVLRGALDFSHRLTGNTELLNRLLLEAGPDNTFARNDLGVSVAMNEAFALKAGLQARHNTNAGPGIRRTDTLTTINLVYSFR